jgi:hypothetical protein
MASRPKLIISCIKFKAEKIAAALRIDTQQAIAAFQDGRGAWPFSEYWGAKLYEFIKHSNTNKPFSDGAVALEQLRDVSISVKSLSKRGIKFQQSKYVGFGRGTDKEGLIASLEACDRVIVVDIRDFPTVRFVPIDATRLLSAAHKGDLTLSGWRPRYFYEWLGKTYEVAEVELKF